MSFEKDYLNYVGPLNGVKTFITAFLCFGMIVVIIGILILTYVFFGTRDRKSVIHGYLNIGFEGKLYLYFQILYTRFFKLFIIAIFQKESL